MQAEQWLDRDRVMIDQLKSLGIEKGKPFAPTAETRQALIAGIREAHMVLEARYDAGLTPFFEGTHWTFPAPPELIEAAKDGFAAPNSFPLDARGLAYHYAYIGIKRLGAGQFYLICIKDKNGETFDGGKTYSLTVPPNAPVEQYWSLTAYDRQTHALIRKVDRASRASNSDEVEKNADGSVDLYLGPKAPAGKESNWIPTDPQLGFELMFAVRADEGTVRQGLESAGRGSCRKPCSHGSDPMRPLRSRGVARCRCYADPRPRHKKPRPAMPGGVRNVKGSDGGLAHHFLTGAVADPHPARRSAARPCRSWQDRGPRRPCPEPASWRSARPRRRRCRRHPRRWQHPPGRRRSRRSRHPWRRRPPYLPVRTREVGRAKRATAEAAKSGSFAWSFLLGYQTAEVATSDRPGGFPMRFAIILRIFRRARGARSSTKSRARKHERSLNNSRRGGRYWRQCRAAEGVRGTWRPGRAAGTPAGPPR